MNENRYAPPVAPVADADAGAALTRPRNVKLGCWILWAELVIGLPGFFYQMFTPPPGVEAGIPHVIYIVVMIITLGIFLLFAWFTYMAWDGRNWARILYLVLISLGLLFSFWALPKAFEKSTYDGVIYIVQTVMSIVGVVLLFSPPANAWYRAMKAARSP